MTETIFDSLAFPSSFDPLTAPLPPPPRRRRRPEGEAAPERPPSPPAAEQRLQALEDEVVVILKARIDGLDKAIEARLDGQMGRIVVKVAEMLEAERLALVGAVPPGRRR